MRSLLTRSAKSGVFVPRSNERACMIDSCIANTMQVSLPSCNLL
jgi:hypothetical protein